MPSEKSARTAETKRLKNRRIRSATRTSMAKAANILQNGEGPDVEAGVVQAIRALDSAVTKGIIHPNNAARRKSRLMAKLNAQGKS